MAEHSESPVIPAPTTTVTSTVGGRRQGRNGTIIALIILGFSAAECFTPAAATVNYTYPAITIAVTIYLIAQRRVDDAIELNLWTWATAAGLRRMVDWGTGHFNSSSLILVAASVAALIIGATALRSHRRWPPGFSYAGFIIVAAGVSACAIGVLANGVVPAAVSAVLWFAPLGIGLVTLAAGADRPRYLTAILRFTRWALPLLGGYALLQWALAPAWDVFWLHNVAPSALKLGSPFGTPQPFGLRPASLVNSPFGFAHLMVFLLFSQLGRVKGRPWAYVSVTLGCAALAITGIRSAWLTAAVAVVVLAISRRMRLWPLVLLGVPAAFAALTFVPQLADSVGRRLQSLQSGSSDISLSARLGTYTQALPSFFRDPIGAGMGATGSGARANPQDVPAFGALDSSYLEIVRTAGSLLGSLVVITIIVLAVTVFNRSRLARLPYPAWGAIALALPIDMLLGNVTSGPTAVVTWLILGMCGGLGVHSSTRPIAAPDWPDQHTLQPSGAGDRALPPRTDHLPPSG